MRKWKNLWKYLLLADFIALFANLLQDTWLHDWQGTIIDLLTLSYVLYLLHSKPRAIDVFSAHQILFVYVSSSSLFQINSRTKGAYHIEVQVQKGPQLLV